MKKTLQALALVLVILLISGTALAVTPQDWDKDHPENLESGHLFAASAILMDQETGHILFSKDPDALMFPASTTKIMTLLLALESDIDPDTVITIPQEAVEIPSDSSKIPVQAGEQITWKDLLYGFMMRSGNDGAIAIAIRVSGSVEAFVERMNERAAELGCVNTHFANPHGYHDANHYTCARDLALITQEAMKNETFRKIASTDTYILAQTNKRKMKEIHSRVEMVVKDSDYYYEYCTGVKTGYTRKAGQCFVGTARKGSRTVIAVVMKSTVDYANRKWFDAKCLFEYAFTRYTTYTLSDFYRMASSSINSIHVENAKDSDPLGGELDLILSQTSDDSYTVMTLKDIDELQKYVDYFNENTTVTPVTTYQERLKNRETIEAGSIVAGISILTLDGKTITGNLIASRNVELEPEGTGMWQYLKENFPFLETLTRESTLYLIITALVILLLILLIARLRRHKRAKRRKRIYEQRRRAYYRHRQYEDEFGNR